MQKFTLCSLNGCGSLVEICLWVNVSVDLDVNCSHEIDNFRLFCVELLSAMFEERASIPV
jgi:hypothetical protein